MESKLFPNEFDDLSHWEFVNSPDADAEAGQFRNDDDYDFEDSLYNEFGSWSSLSSTDDESEDKDCVIETVVVVEPPIMEDSEKAGNFNEVDDHEQYEDKDEDDNDDDEEDDVDLDDELVPWYLNDRFGRGRMRKLGKRSYAKMTKSKRVAYTLNRPGCVHGKHGLGLKHSF